MTVTSFDFTTANRIVFGRGKLDELPIVIKGFGLKTFIVRSPDPNAFSKMIQILDNIKLNYESIIVEGEPTVESVIRAVNFSRETNCDFVIGIGGGSVIDTAKVVAALLTNQGELMDYLEVVGKGLPLIKRCAPLIAIPTTAGTGSEVTRNAVIDVPDKKVKVSMRSSLLLPWVSLIDPLLTLSLPSSVTAFTGMDAFVQVLEPYVSIKANCMTDIFCRDGIRKAAQAILVAYQDGKNENARTDMSMVSLLGGLCLANSGLGAVHGFAGVIGGMFHAPHGAICASLLPSVIKINSDALKERDPQSQALKRYSEIARIVINHDNATITDGINWFKNLCSDLKIPHLRDLNVNKKEFSEVVKMSQNASSMKGNPIVLTTDEMTEILTMAF